MVTRENVSEMIFVIDDNEELAECVTKATGQACSKFTNVIEAIQAIDESGVPEMIFMEMVTTGPDGFTFLNEMMSYDDTARVPIVLMSDKNIAKVDLSDYGVVGVLNKDTMTPKEVQEYVQKYARN